MRAASIPFLLFLLILFSSCARHQEQAAATVLDSTEINEKTDGTNTDASSNKEGELGTNKNVPLYRVLKANEGGWKTSDVAAPFTVGTKVYCHKDMAKCSLEGVDYLSDETAIECNVELADESLLRLKCTDDDGKTISRLMSTDCCETVHSGDTSVYATPLNLIHYATWGNTEPIPIATGIKMVEQRYQTQLRKRHAPVLFLHYAHFKWDDKIGAYSIDNNVPRRVEKSSKYIGPYCRTLLRRQNLPLVDKRTLAMKSRALGLNIRGGPFLATYLTLPEALEVVEEPSTQLVLKRITNEYGNGLWVDTREEVEEIWREYAPSVGKHLVAQEIITDAAKILNHEFDVKFFILIHAGRVYMHQNAQVVLEPRKSLKQHNASNSAESTECVNSFLSKHSFGEKKQWQEGIFAQLVASLPVMEPVVRATAEEKDGMLYHIFSGRAIIRNNGEAHVLAYQDWPIVDWAETGYDDAACDASTTALTPEERKLVYETTMAEMFADFFSIALGLANTTSITDDSELLEGRVREVIGFRSPVSQSASSQGRRAASW